MSLPINQIIQGDCLEVMKTFSDESIDMAITSPPYYGMRIYGKEARRIWGGDKGCIHQWAGDSVPGEKSGKPGPGSTISKRTQTAMDAPRRRNLHAGRGDCQKSAKYSEQKSIPDVPIIESTCAKCGAWFGELGLEPHPYDYVEHLLMIIDEVWRVLKKTGSFWLNISDTYAGSGCGTNDYHTEASKSISGKGKNALKYIGARPQNKARVVRRKSLLGLPELLVVKMTHERKWIRRNTVIWHKKNHLPGPWRDRFTNAYEQLIFFTKSERYYSDLEAAREPHSKNPGDVWSIPVQGFSEAHYATYPPKLIERPILFSCPEWVCRECGQPRFPVIQKIGKERVSWGVDRKARVFGTPGQPAMRNITRISGWTNCGCGSDFEGGIVLDPFVGSGTTALVALQNNRQFIGIDIVKENVKMAKKRIKEVQPRLI